MGWKDAPLAAGSQAPAWEAAPIVAPSKPAAASTAVKPAWETAPLVTAAVAKPTEPKLDSHVTKPLLSNEPDRTYGSILPVSYKTDAQGNKVDGTTELAFPEIIRAPVRAMQIPGRITKGEQVSEQEMQEGARDMALGAAFGMGPRTFANKAPKPTAIPGAQDIPKPPPGPDLPPTPVDVVVKPDVPKTATQQAKDAAIGLRNIFSPTSAGPNAKTAETSVRDFEGTGLRNRAQAEHELAAFTAKGDQLVQDPAKLNEFYTFVQGRSKGAKLSDPELQPFADSLRTLSKEAEDQLRALPQAENMNFLTDYFPQMWKNPEQANAFVQQWVGKQGNTKFMQARKYPTIADGMKAGLELADPNPANAMLSYITNTQKYIAQAKVFNEGRELGLIKFGTPGGKVPEGWVPLEGRFANKPARTIEKEGMSMPVPAQQAYAPADYGLVYNNYLSRGFEATKGKDVYQAVRSFKNAQTMLQLGFSTHHMATIMAQSMAADLGRVLKNAAAGDLKGVGGAVKDLVGTPLPVVGRTFRQGKKLRQQYEGIKDYGPEMEERAKLFASAGGRVGEDPLYRGTTEKSLLQSAKEGTLWNEIKAGADTAIKSKGFSTPMQAVKVAGRVADTVAHPLFNRYIPNMKLGAFDSQMKDWMRQNPNATGEETRVAAKHIMDLMDERFGEIADSNIFWDRTTKQVLGTLFRAPNWNLGLIRQSFGGVADTGAALKSLVKTGKIPSNLQDRPSYLMGYALLLAGVDAAMGYAKTGQLPDEAKDLITYETGGKTPAGYDERALLPGHPKEVIHMFPDPGGSPTSGFAHLLENKWSSPVSAGYEAYTNKDWRGDPIGNYAERAKHVLVDPFMPLQLSNMWNGAPAGSNLSQAERFMNINPAPSTITETERIRNINRSMKSKAERKKMKNQNRDRARYPDKGM